jgi:hypothetical protein
MVLVLKRCCYIMVDPKMHVLENGVWNKNVQWKIHQNARPSQKKAQINFCIVSRVGNFRQKNYSTEDGIDGTIVCSGRIPAVPRNRILRNSVPNPSAEEKTTRNSVPWNKNTSKLSEFRFKAFDNFWGTDKSFC